MRFASGVFIKTILWLLVISLLQDEVHSESESEKEKRCERECGGDEARKEASIKAELICTMPLPDIYGSITPCVSKCTGKKAEEDQLKCFKGKCHSSRGVGFCEKPGMPNIQEDQCDELLTAGKVKLHARTCKNTYWA